MSPGSPPAASPPPRCEGVRRRLESQDLGAEGPMVAEDREHLAGCAGCAAHRARLGRAAEALRGIPRMRPIPPTLRRRIEEILPPPDATGAGADPGSPAPARAVGGPGLTADPFTGAARPAQARVRTLRARARSHRGALAGLAAGVLLTLGLLLAEGLWASRQAPPAPPGIGELLREHAAARDAGSVPGPPFAPELPPPPLPVVPGTVFGGARRATLGAASLAAGLYRGPAAGLSVYVVPEGAWNGLDAGLAALMGPREAAAAVACAEAPEGAVCGLRIGEVGFLVASEAPAPAVRQAAEGVSGTNTSTFTPAVP
ncbi:hypothetical protein L6R50_05600 [Myxococcota bacterium]|nr:hypothetical protein [Myxococcota bacterium]